MESVLICIIITLILLNVVSRILARKITYEKFFSVVHDYYKMGKFERLSNYITGHSHVVLKNISRFREDFLKLTEDTGTIESNKKEV